MQGQPDAPPAPEPNARRGRVNGRFYHVQVRPRAAFTEFRTPLAAGPDGSSVDVTGCDVREGRLGPTTWLVESVLIPREVARNEGEAEELAGRVVDELES